MGLSLLGWDCRFKIISELDEFFTCRNIKMEIFIQRAYLLLNAVYYLFILGPFGDLVRILAPGHEPA